MLIDILAWWKYKQGKQCSMPLRYVSCSGLFKSSQLKKEFGKVNKNLSSEDIITLAFPRPNLAVAQLHAVYIDGIQGRW